MGPRLPAGLLPPRRRGALARAEAIVASTATATPQVADDIVARLGLRDPVRVATGFDRPNLSFAVVPVRDEGGWAPRDRRGAGRAGALPAIVYAGTRAACDKLAARLAGELGRPVLAYHAGLPREARAEAQRRFMDGDVDVVVATNAFGMGVDKADVRTVCHEAVPGSIEAYYQEAGRAGRDGAPARCLLFASARDKGLHVFFIERSTVEEPALKAVARALTGSRRVGAGGGRQPGIEVRRAAQRLARHAGCDEEVVRAIVGHLARIGVIQPSPSSPDRVLGRVSGTWDGRALALCRSAAQEGTRARWRQYRSVWAWVEGDGCRRARHPASLRRSPGPVAGRALLRRLRSVAAPPMPGPPARRSGSGPRQLAQRPVAPGDTAALDEAIVEVVALARPALGRRARSGPPGGRSRCCSSTAGTPATLRDLRPSARPSCWRRRRAAGSRDDQVQWRVLPGAGGGVQVFVLASGDGRTCRPTSSTASMGARASRSSPSACRTPAGALERARGLRRRRRRESPSTAGDRRARSSAIADGSRAHGVELVVLRLHAAARPRGSSPASRSA